MRAFLILLVIFLPLIVCSQPRFNWATSYISDLQMNQSSMVIDSKGNTWCMMASPGPMEFPELNFKVEYPQHAAHVITRLNSKGKADMVIATDDQSWRGMGSMACTKDNELWLWIPFSESVTLRTLTDEVVVPHGKKGGMLLAAIRPNGKIRFAKNIDVWNYDNTVEIAFDPDGNAHLICQWIDEQYEPYNGIQPVSHKHQHLFHVITDSEGEVLRTDDIYMGSEGYPGLSGSQLHIAEKGDLYITTRYSNNITLNGEEIVSDVNPIVKDHPWSHDHGVILHFDKTGKFTWHRTISGYGGQHIVRITSDKNNIYVCGKFDHEYCINQDNSIISDYKTPYVTGGNFTACFDHTGTLKWSDHIGVRPWSGSWTECYLLETDGRGSLVSGFTFNDTLDILTVNGKVELPHYRNRAYETCVVVRDTLGNILEVRKDVVQKDGYAIILGGAAYNDQIGVCGAYMGKSIPINWNDTVGDYTGSRQQTDIRVSINKTTSEPFRNPRVVGGVFYYSFTQPPLPHIEKEPEPQLLAIEAVSPGIEGEIPPSTSLGYPPVAPIPSLSDSTQAGTQPILPPSTSIGELAMSIYPNPSRGKMEITLQGLSGSCELHIRDEHGKLIFSKTMIVDISSLMLSYNFPEWAAGTYYVTATSGSGVMTRRWVKMG